MASELSSRRFKQFKECGEARQWSNFPTKAVERDQVQGALHANLHDPLCRSSIFRAMGS